MMGLRNIREPDCLSDASFHSGGGFKTAVNLWPPSREFHVAVANHSGNLAGMANFA
jgi:hypothetical protein